MTSKGIPWLTVEQERNLRRPEFRLVILEAMGLEVSEGWGRFGNTSWIACSDPGGIRNESVLVVRPKD